jgi:hypothetical protein
LRGLRISDLVQIQVVMSAVSLALKKKKFDDPVYDDDEVEALMKYMQLETYQEFQRIIEGIRPQILK